MLTAEARKLSPSEVWIAILDMPSTTWAFVRRRPSGPTKNPLPDLSPALTETTAAIVSCSIWERVIGAEGRAAVDRRTAVDAGAILGNKLGSTFRESSVSIVTESNA